MISNWRLSKKEVALIAYALKQLSAEYVPVDKQIPQKLYETEVVNYSDYNSLMDRFSIAANSSFENSAQSL